MTPNHKYHVYVTDIYTHNKLAKKKSLIHIIEYVERLQGIRRVKGQEFINIASSGETYNIDVPWELFGGKAELEIILFVFLQTLP